MSVLCIMYEQLSSLKLTPQTEALGTRKLGKYLNYSIMINSDGNRQTLK